MDSFIKALIHIHNLVDPERQWKRAIESLRDMSNMDISLAWIHLSKHAMETGSENTRDDYKVLYERVLREGDCAESHESDECCHAKNHFSSALNKIALELERLRFSVALKPWRDQHTPSASTDDSDAPIDRDETTGMPTSRAASRAEEYVTHESTQHKTDQMLPELQTKIDILTQKVIEIKTVLTPIENGGGANTMSHPIESRLETIESLLKTINTGERWNAVEGKLTAITDVLRSRLREDLHKAVDGTEPSETNSMLAEKIQIVIDQHKALLAQIKESNQNVTDTVTASVKQDMQSVEDLHAASLTSIDQNITELKEYMQTYQEASFAELDNRLNSVYEKIYTLSTSTETQISEGAKAAISENQTKEIDTSTDSIINKYAASILRSFKPQLAAISEEINDMQKDFISSYETESDTDKVDSDTPQRSAGIKKKIPTPGSQRVQALREKSPYHARTDHTQRNIRTQSEAELKRREKGYKPTGSHIDPAK